MRFKCVQLSSTDGANRVKLNIWAMPRNNQNDGDKKRRKNRKKNCQWRGPDDVKADVNEAANTAVDDESALCENAAASPTSTLDDSAAAAAVVVVAANVVAGGDNDDITASSDKATHDEHSCENNINEFS